MRLRTILVSLAAITTVSCMPPEMARKDMLRAGRVGCEKGDGAACFHAGVLYAEGGDAEHAATLHAKGCALKNAASCDALAQSTGPNRESLLAAGCNAGDLLTCTRLAADYGKDPAGSARATAIDQQVCGAASSVSPALSARDLHGAATGCARLALASAKGTGAKSDFARTTKLEALATMLLTESLFRLEKQLDAESERELASPAAKPNEKDRADRIAEATGRWREELLKTLETGSVADAPLATPLTLVEQVFHGIVTPSSVTRAPGVDDATHCKETGDAFSCTLAAGRLDATDPAAALELHAAGCAKRPEQCWGLVGYAESSFRKRDAPRAGQILQKGCDLKAPNACLRLAVELDQGERGLAADPTKAARLLERACDQGGARACLYLAALVDDGRGTAKNPARAKQLRSKADELDKPQRKSVEASASAEEVCRKSRQPESCEAAGSALQDTDAVKAEELFRIACPAQRTSCGLWSFAIDRFRRDDTSRGMRLLEQGCQDGSATACTLLAEVLRVGYRSVPRAEPRASETFQKACELGDAIACRFAASRLRSAKNAAKADELRDRALKLEEQAGDRWAKDVAEGRTQGPHVEELGRARAEWRAFVERVAPRAQARTQRLEGRKGPAPSPFAKEDVDASTKREAEIRRLASALASAEK